MEENFRGRRPRVTWSTRIQVLIAIGGIHGCYAEFSELLERVSLTADDQRVGYGGLPV